MPLPSPKQENKKANIRLVRRWYPEVWCEGKAGVARALSHPAVVGHLEGMPDTDIEGFLEFHSALQNGISELHVEILEATAAGDKVVVHWHMTGRHTAPLMGVPPSGRNIDETGMTKFKIVDGIVHEGWDSWNLNAFLERLAQPDPAVIARYHGLTARQAEVALLMAEKTSTKRIAAELGIAYNTARRHCNAVLRRLGIHSRGDVEAALANGRLSRPSAAEGREDASADA